MKRSTLPSPSFPFQFFPGFSSEASLCIVVELSVLSPSVSRAASVYPPPLSSVLEVALASPEIEKRKQIQDMLSALDSVPITAKTLLCFMSFNEFKVYTSHIPVLFSSLAKFGSSLP